MATDVVTLLRRVAPPVLTDPDGWDHLGRGVTPHITALPEVRSETSTRCRLGLSPSSRRVPLPLARLLALAPAHSEFDPLIVVGHAMPVTAACSVSCTPNGENCSTPKGKLILAREELVS